MDIKIMCRLSSWSWLLAFLFASTPQGWTQSVPDQYKRFFFHYADSRGMYEKALNSVGLTQQAVGKGFALIAGVSQYPNFPDLVKTLRPAQIDIDKLAQYLKDQEFFDEIVVLKDGD